MLPSYRLHSPTSSSPTSSDTDAASSADAGHPTNAAVAVGATHQSSLFRRRNNADSQYRSTALHTRTSAPFRSHTVNHYRNRNALAPSRELLSDEKLLGVPQENIAQDSPSPPRSSGLRNEFSLPFSPFEDGNSESPHSNSDPHDEEEFPEPPLSPTASYKSSVRNNVLPAYRRTAPNVFVQYEAAPRSHPKASYPSYIRDSQGLSNQRLPTTSLSRRTFAHPPLNRNEDTLSKIDAMDAALRRTSSSTSIARRKSAASKTKSQVGDDASVRGDSDNAKLRRSGTESRIAVTPLGSSFHRNESTRVTANTSFTRSHNSTTSITTLRRTRPSKLLGSRRNTQDNDSTRSTAKSPLLSAPVPLPRRGSLERLPPRIPRNSSAARDIRQGADSVKAQLSSMFDGDGDTDMKYMPTLRRSSLCSLPSKQQSSNASRPRLAAFRHAAIKGSASFALRRRRQDDDSERVVEFASNPNLHRTFSASGSVRSAVVGR